ncbi:hypothetical protein [Treponema pallidum]|uniref:hypothetical protein n=1 Tax=Treponema pallidum TaxID=160 RepID=UPI00158C6571|nr:hypothetical protein [Treponema pallidum]
MTSLQVLSIISSFLTQGLPHPPHVAADSHYISKKDSISASVGLLTSLLPCLCALHAYGVGHRPFVIVDIFYAE